MKPAQTNNKSSGNEDVFEYFKKVTHEAFQFLIDDYDFKHVRTASISYECVIEYWNETTCVRITCEWPYTVWVDFSWLEITPNGTTVAEPRDLELLLTIRCPEKKVKQKKHPTNEDLDELIYTYAALLKEYAHDILTGDFRIYSQLNVLAQEATEKYWAQFSPKKARKK